MKDILHPEFLERNTETCNTQKYFRQGDIFYPKTCKYCSMTFKTRPVMIASVMDNFDTDMIVAYEITGNFYTPSQIPIILENKVSFISPFREIMLSSSDLYRNLYYGAVDLRVLEMIKYIKLKHLTGLYSEEYEKYIKAYCEECLNAIENQSVILQRSNAPVKIIRQTYLGGGFKNIPKDDSDDETELVYSESAATDEESSSITLGNLITSEMRAMIQQNEEDSNQDESNDESSPKDEANKKTKNVIVRRENMGGKKSNTSVKQKMGRPTYWIKTGGYKYLRDNSSITMAGKLNFLTDLYHTGSMTKFATQYSVTAQTIRNRVNKYIDELKGSEFEPSNEIIEALSIKHKTAKVTPPPAKQYS